MGGQRSKYRDVNIYLMEVFHLNIPCYSCAKYLVVSLHEALFIFMGTII